LVRLFSNLKVIITFWSGFACNVPESLLFYNRNVYWHPAAGQSAYTTQLMENLHPESTGSDSQGSVPGESLSDYVKRMETEENLKKLASKLKDELKKPTPEGTPDLSFEKFEKKQKNSGGQ
jgi:hypothetical protein